MTKKFKQILFVLAALGINVIVILLPYFLNNKNILKTSQIVILLAMFIVLAARILYLEKSKKIVDYRSAFLVVMFAFFLIMIGRLVYNHFIVI